MLSQRKIKRILIDAEKAFGEEPARGKNNSGGLCLFIGLHPMMEKNKKNTIRKYQKDILGGRFSNSGHTFGLYNQAGHGQWLCWHRPKLHHLRFERRDWCRQELKRRFNYEVEQ